MNCLFCKIGNGDIPSDKVYEDDDVMAFRDINPAAPLHLLIIPKKHISTMNDAKADDQLLLGKMMLLGKDLAAQAGFDEAGYRLALNTNSDGGQSVYHIHLHLLAGRQMAWPPG